MMKFDLGIVYENADIFGFSGEQMAAIERAGRAANSSPEIIELLGHDLDFLKDFDDIRPSLDAPYGGEPGMHLVLALICHFPELKARYRAHSIPDSVLKDTMSDISIWMDSVHSKTGRWGLERIGWLAHHFKFELFRLGRLQFMAGRAHIQAQVYKNAAGESIALAPDGAKYTRGGEWDGTDGIYDELAWMATIDVRGNTVAGYPIDARGLATRERVSLSLDEWTLAFEQGGPILDVHIPEGAPLDTEAVKESFAMAPAFFDRHLGLRGFAAFTCGSWLLDWALPVIVPGSNLARFQQLFNCVPTDSGDWQMYERVFGGPIDDMRLAPEDTSLRRAIKKWYLEGNRCRGAQGYILINY